MNPQTDPPPRHQCLIYEGAPSLQLRAMAATAAANLRRNYRCLYLNSRPMVAGMRSYLAAADIDVERALEKRSLIASSDQTHLVGGRFDPVRMVQELETAVVSALEDGYDGLWASGDMTWELGGDYDIQKILDYEWRLEKLFHRCPHLSGICQYHAGTLPRELVQQATLTHPVLFLNESYSVRSPSYCLTNLLSRDALSPADRESVVARLR